MCTRFCDGMCDSAWRGSATALSGIADHQWLYDQKSLWGFYSSFHNDRPCQFFYTDGISKHISDPRQALRSCNHPCCAVDTSFVTDPLIGQIGDKQAGNVGAYHYEMAVSHRSYRTDIFASKESYQDMIVVWPLWLTLPTRKTSLNFTIGWRVSVFLVQIIYIAVQGVNSLSDSFFEVSWIYFWHISGSTWYHSLGCP